METLKSQTQEILFILFIFGCASGSQSRGCPIMHIEQPSSVQSILYDLNCRCFSSFSSVCAEEKRSGLDHCSHLVS